MDELSIYVAAVKPDTQKWQIFVVEDDVKPFGEQDYIISGLIEPDGMGGGEITNVQGKMTNKSNELMATTMRDLGYDYIFFRARKEKKVTHYATLVGEDEQFKFYHVPLRDMTTDDGK